jgi:uncharacterized SAM-binding protein YcdF (DUF218 family)
MRILRWVLGILVLGVLAVAAGEWALWRAVPGSNTAREKFDVILVLGNPSKADGTPGPEQRERVLEAVREWRKGVAPRIVMSGGAAHNGFVEGETMKTFAVQQGVPAEDVIVEGQAKDTVQNVFYTAQIMKASGWQSAEVVSNWYHLPRTGRILEHFPIEWRTDAAEWPPEYTFRDKWKRDWHEVQLCLALRMHGFKASRFISQ